VHGRDYVTPDDVKACAASALSHRIIVKPEYRVRGTVARQCVDEVVGRVPVPVEP